MKDAVHGLPVAQPGGIAGGCELACGDDLFQCPSAEAGQHVALEDGAVFKQGEVGVVTFAGPVPLDGVALDRPLPLPLAPGEVVQFSFS